MKKLLNITKVVKEILEERPSTRDDDNLLWLEVLRAAVRDWKYGSKMTDLTLAYVLTSIHRLGLPSFASVSRARRKLQEKYPELRGTRTTQEKRKEREAVYEEYARNGSV